MQSPSTKGVAYTPLPHGHDTHSRHASISTLVNEKTNSPGQPSPSKHSQSLARSALHRLLSILLITCLGCAYWFFPRSGNESIATPSGASDNAIPISCSRDANFANPCLVERPFGLVLLAQMYNPDLGAIDPWMIHGLWGNFCNGSYLASCDPAREHHDIPTLLRRYRQNFLLNYMQFMWKNDPPITGTNGTAADLWAHEWNKHGTCMSTLYPNCYDDYQPGQEVVDYFATTVRLARSLPTSYWLEDCGILPSIEKTYSWAQIALCLAEGNGGFTPYLGCDDEGRLREVWYYHYWEGSVRDGHALGADSNAKSTCPEKGVKYLPKAT